MTYNLEEFDKKYSIAKENLLEYSDKVLKNFKTDLSNITSEYKAIPAFDFYFDSKNSIHSYIDEKYPQSELISSSGTHLFNIETVTCLYLKKEVQSIHKKFSEAYKEFLKGLPENSSHL